MGHRLVKMDEVKLTKKVLQQMRGRAVVPGERELSKPRLRWMAGLLQTKRFNRCDWATCYCKSDKKTYRVNGQHGSHSLQEVLSGGIADAIFPDGIPVFIQHWECDTPEDLPNVFDEFDQPEMTRTPKDKLGQYLSQHSDLEGVGRDFCGRMLNGVDWASRNLEVIRSTMPEDLIPGRAYHRGRLLNIDSVREFIGYMYEYDNAPFGQWTSKPGIVGEFFKAFLEMPRDDFDVLVRQTLYEVGDTAVKFTKMIRAECNSKGREPGYFYRLTEKHFRKLSEEMEQKGKDTIKSLIKEVLREQEESNGEEEEAA